MLLAHLLHSLKSIDLGHYTQLTCGTAHREIWQDSVISISACTNTGSHTNSERDPLSKTEVICVTRAYTLNARSLQSGSTVSLRCANDAIMLTALSLLGRFLHSGLFLGQGTHPAATFIPWL